MNIPWFRNNLLVMRDQLRRRQKFAARTDSHPYFVMDAQSCARFIEAISIILLSDDICFLGQVHACIQDLKANPVWDESLNEPFCVYQSWLEDLTAAVDSVEPCYLTCQHPRIRYDGFVSCMDCYHTLGWLCESDKSPDRCCHYYTYEFPGVGNGILLNDGSIFKMAKSKHETSDACLFCGEPQERR